MSGKSDIEWTDCTWNPARGCVKISPGCKHCYAETFAERWRGVPGHAYERGFDPRFVPDQLDAPFKWKKPRRVFVNSMSDLFLEAFDAETEIAAVFNIMARCHRHTFQVLTKRAERMCELVSDSAFMNVSLGGWFASVPWPLPNVHLGVSVEDRKHGVPRIAHLQATPASVRFLSIEPLLEDIGEIDLTGIGWVIAGAESGNRARPMDDEWVRSIRDQCTAAHVPFFYKQQRVGRKIVSLPMLDGRQWAEFPQAVTP